MGIDPNDIRLNAEDKELLARAAEDTGRSWRETLRAAVNSFLERSVKKSEPNGAPTTAEPTKPIWEVFDDIIGTIPDEEFAKLPTDGAEQHDHYIYGLPKKTQ